MSDDRHPLHTDLRALDARLRQEMRSKWSRDLPFEELVFDRWERAASLGFGPDASIYQASYVYGDVKVGAGSWIGPFTILDGSGGPLRIGEHCSVSAGVQIYTHDSVKWALSGGRSEYERGAVSIGNACYLGPNAIVSRGVTVGNHVLVAGGSLVNRDVPDFAIVGGTPARVLGRVNVTDAGVELDFDKA